MRKLFSVMLVLVVLLASAPLFDQRRAQRAGAAQSRPRCCGIRKALMR